MQSAPSIFRRSILLFAVCFGCQVHAAAATGVSACDTRNQSAEASNLSLVDYDQPSSQSAATELLMDASGISAKALVLTPEVDTSIRREDRVNSDLELPSEESPEQKPDAAALLLERRNTRIREASDDAEAEMNTELPGMDESEMLQFRQQMYRTDI